MLPRHINSSRRGSSRHSFGAIWALLAVCAIAGCAEEKSEAPAAVPPPAVPKVVVQNPIEVREGQSFLHHLFVSNRAEFPQGVRFRATGALPEGCKLDDITGELQWKPTELQGPGMFGCEIICYPSDAPDNFTTVSCEFAVIETNAAPVLEFPEVVKGTVGKELAVPLTAKDADFPSNKVLVALKDGVPEGMTYDPILSQIHWSIPRSHSVSKPVTLLVTATDDGMPPQVATKRLTIQLERPMVSAPVPPPMVEKRNERTPQHYVELPPLPSWPKLEVKQGKVPIPSVMSGGDGREFRLALMIPEELKRPFSIKYVEGGTNDFHVMLAEPFEVESENELPKGAIARCSFDGKALRWDWAVTKDRTARDYQNNVRHCVISMQTFSEGDTTLVALQKPLELPAVTLRAILSSDEIDVRLSRYEHGRIHAMPAMHGVNCRLKTRTGELPLKPQIDANLLVLSNGPMVKDIDFEKFNLIVVQRNDELRMTIDSIPSVEVAAKQLQSATKVRNAARVNIRKFAGKLAGAQRALVAANRLPAGNANQINFKNAQVGTAAKRANAAGAQLAKLRAEYPGQQLLVEKLTERRNELQKQLTPVVDYAVQGEFCRRIGDVKVVAAVLK